MRLHQPHPNPFEECVISTVFTGGNNGQGGADDEKTKSDIGGFYLRSWFTGEV